MNFEDEPYARVYTRDTVTWKMLGWEGQTVLLHMLRDKFDRSGIFELDGHDLSQAVTAITGLPLEVTEPGIKKLLSTKTWVLSGGKLVWPKLIEGQTCRRSDRARQQESRQNRKKDALQEQEPARDVSTPFVTDVTRRHAPSQPVTLSLAEPSLAEHSNTNTPQPPSAERAPAFSGGGYGAEKGLGIQDRAKALTPWDPTKAGFLAPHTWPEVLSVATALHTAMRSPGKPRLSCTHRGVQMLVEHFAAGWTEPELLEAARRVVTLPFWGANCGLASLTPDVLERMQAERPLVPDPELEAKRKAIIAKHTEALEREQRAAEPKEPRRAPPISGFAKALAPPAPRHPDTPEALEAKRQASSRALADFEKELST